MFVKRLFIVSMVLPVLLLDVSTVSGQDEAAAAEVAVEAPAEAVAPAETAAPVTRVVEFSGRALYRTSADAEWQPVTEGQVLPVGTELRTSIRTEVILQVGPAALVKVDSLSHLSVSDLGMADGEQTIRSTLGLKYGSVDFHVEHVGFKNDFTIASPSDVLAVKGTIGSFRQFGGPPEVVGHFSNRTNAIALTQQGTGQTTNLSGSEQIGGGTRDPKQHAQMMNQKTEGGDMAGGGRSPTRTTEKAPVNETMSNMQSGRYVMEGQRRMQEYDNRLNELRERMGQAPPIPDRELTPGQCNAIRQWAKNHNLDDHPQWSQYLDSVCPIEDPEK